MSNLWKKSLTVVMQQQGKANHLKYRTNDGLQTEGARVAGVLEFLIRYREYEDYHGNQLSV